MGHYSAQNSDKRVISFYLWKIWLWEETTQSGTVRSCFTASSTQLSVACLTHICPLSFVLNIRLETHIGMMIHPCCLLPCRIEGSPNPCRLYEHRQKTEYSRQDNALWSKGLGWRRGFFPSRFLLGSALSLFHRQIWIPHIYKMKILLNPRHWVPPRGISCSCDVCQANIKILKLETGGVHLV